VAELAEVEDRQPPVAEGDARSLVLDVAPRSLVVGPAVRQGLVY
jgi:hypothetical protein